MGPKGARRVPDNDPKRPPPRWAQTELKTEFRNRAESRLQKGAQGRIPKRDRNGLKTLDVSRFRWFFRTRKGVQNGLKREGSNGPKKASETGSKASPKRPPKTDPKRTKNERRNELEREPKLKKTRKT